MSKKVAYPDDGSKRFLRNLGNHLWGDRAKILALVKFIILKKSYDRQKNLQVAKRALGNGQCTSNLVTRYAKRTRTNGQIFRETESVATACIYFDELTVICTVECRKAYECVQTSCRLRVLDDINYPKAKLLFCPMLQDSHKTIAVWRFRLVRASSECNTGGIILTGETEVRTETCHCVTWSTTTFTWTGPGSDHGLRGDRPATNRPRGVARPIRRLLFI